MTELQEALGLCPPSDAAQRSAVADEVGVHELEDLRGAVVFGTGVLGSATAARLRDLGLEPAAFCDNDASRWGATIEGITVIPPAEVPGGRTVVIASKWVKEIDAGLRSAGVPQPVPHYVLALLFPQVFDNAYHSLAAEAITAAKGDIEAVGRAFADTASACLFAQIVRFRITLRAADLPDACPDQYFPRDLWHLDSPETYVDVGACGGDTLVGFLQRAGGDFRRYYAFEPDPANLTVLRRTVTTLSDPRIVVVPRGAGSRRSHVAFLSGQGGESRVAADAPDDIEVVPLDEELSGEPVTSVKVDVEGYEREVLDGARVLICSRSPKLALSVYHRLPDLWEIPVLVRSCNAGYTYHLRQHTAEIYDTVLYCIPRNG